MRALIALLVLLVTFACSATPAQVEVVPAVVTGFIENGDVRLSYELNLPKGRAPFPAVVIGHGSGKATKETCRFMSVRMLERGYATLCYDKRGVGQSTGQFVFVGTADSPWVFPELASDMAAGVRHLRGRRDIDRTRIGLIGVSQAGWIIPLAAEMSSAAFMILLVGPTVSVGEEMFYSRFAEGTTLDLDEAYAKLPEFQGPYGFDPRPVLDKLTVPGLWLLGGQDRSIPTPRTTKILDDLIASGRPYEYHVYPNNGHDLGGAPYWIDVDRWLARLPIRPR
jgi:uncharacterized protein